MTTFEYFKKKYDDNHDLFVKRINPEIKVDSYKFVKLVWENFWGGTVEVDKHYNIIGVDDTKEMLNLGYLERWDDNSWKAKQLGADRHIALTLKGLKAIYKEMF